MRRPQLRAEVESLLASHERAGGFLKGSAIHASAVQGEFQPADFGGRTIGPFRLVEKIGEGGMGVVYRAERADGDFTQRVAVKLIDAPLRDPDALRRFRAERQILATLSHPHIVTLLDGGITAEGQPYLVMEYVDGVPITTYCAERALPVEGRLRLFQQLCAAVQDAHQHGVVHRDLKPGNILVAADEIPKILDFGVAKLLDASGGVVDATVTGLLQPLTPNYASPEQLRGLPVTTACDIYALGALLYELLAGVRSYETTGKSLDTILRIVVEQDPPRPSDTVGRADARLPYDRRRLKGDLDAIVLKAMAKEPERRYASARELSDDLTRYLSGRPVVAREPSLGYVIRRLASRHKAAFVSAGVSLAVIVAALVVAIWQARIATIERDRSQLEAAKASQVSAFLRSLFTSGALSATKGEELTVQDLLETGVARIEKELAGQPEVEAAMLATLGLVYTERSMLARATPLLERSLALRESVLPPDHKDVGESLWALGMLKVRLSDYEGARRHLERGVRIREKVLGPEHPLLPEVLSELGNVLFFTGKYEEGRAVLQRAVAIEEKHGGRRLVYWLANLSNLEVALDNYANAQALLERAVANAIKHDGRATVRATAALVNLALVLRQQENFPRARQLFEQVLEIETKAYGPESPQLMYTVGEMGEFFTAIGDRERAREFLDRSIRGTEKAYGPEHHGLAEPLTYYGRLLLAEGNPREALIPLERSLRVREKVLGSQRHNEIAVNLVDIANAKGRLEGGPAAEPILRRALAIQREVLIPGHRGLVPTLLALSEVLPADAPAESRALTEEAVRIARAKLPAHHSVRLRSGAALQRFTPEK